ncbi:hypothetical protein SLEP1_g35866 [Rubroshorea leprosula]|uniref:Uncharacterized protein n=1 Tax=Rubroshorea leprosula TaxID=152421 RepID=A0AAV5KPP8_9ROSI|nr:hypothetical protein SLEP1_g35866 [Rubroshorea leprosula]
MSLWILCFSCCHSHQLLCDLPLSRHHDEDNEDDDEDDDGLLAIEEDEDVDEAETGEAVESDEQTDDSEAVVGAEEASKEPDADEDSDDFDSGMDDDAMFRMDTYLAQICKEKKNQTGSETAQSQPIVFTLHILSLLEIYLHEHRGKPQIHTAAIVGYFDSKKSQIKSGVSKEIFRRNPRIGHHLCGFILEKCASATSDFRRVDALDMVIEILRSAVPSSSKDSSHNASKKIMKGHLQSLSHLIQALVIRMPTKQSRRAEVRKFCGKMFEMISAHDVIKSFLKRLGTDAYTACESQLGEFSLKLKRLE